MTNDRCSRCNSEAYVMTLHSGLTLFWCKHHYEKHEHLLSGNVYIDERHRLTATT